MITNVVTRGIFDAYLLANVFPLPPDVVFVVDCGRVKENRKDELNEMPTLVETWVSRASAKVSYQEPWCRLSVVSFHMLIFPLSASNEEVAQVEFVLASLITCILATPSKMICRSIKCLKCFELDWRIWYYKSMF